MNLNIKQNRFIINTLWKAAEKNNVSVIPKVRSRFFLSNTFAQADPYTAELSINKVLNCRILRPLIKRLIKHETKHIEQFQVMARFFAGLADNVDAGINNFKQFLLDKAPVCEVFKFNTKFYQKTIENDGVIKEGHPLFEKAKQYIKAHKEYPDLSPFTSLEIYQEKGYKEMRKFQKQRDKLYKTNLLEVEARKAEKIKLK